MTQKSDVISERIFLILGMGMFLYHMVSTQYLFLGSYEHQNTHLVFLLVLIFLSTFRQTRSNTWKIIQVILMVLGIGATMYVFFNIVHLEEVVGFPEPIDQVVSVILIILVTEATRQAWGWTLPIVVSLFVVYFFLGHLIPGPLYHRPFSIDYVLSYLCIGLSGVYGTFLAISANFIFLFVVFGALMEVIKINDLFFEAGKVAGKFLQGGPGHTAVVSSSMVGMVSGAAVANVAITGAFTIPYMKRVGYHPNLAGAIEATASTGGQLMPPVMGASAFLMAFFLGVPYVEVMLAGILPAVFYYLAVGIGVQLIAVSNNIRSPLETPDWSMIFRRMPLFIVPIGFIVILLVLRYSPMLAAFWAIIAAVLLSYLSRETRPTVMSLIRCFSRGALVGARIGASLAVVGIMAQTLISTGLGTKIAGLVESLSGGNLIIALLITMFVSILLGCGCPTTAAYSLVAIVVVPALIKFGIEPISAHFFAFYFAIISALTPPVALAALAGAGIAGGSYFKTAINAFKLAIAGFIIPYLIVFNPILTLHPESWITGAGSIISITIGLTAISAFLYDCGLVKLSGKEKILTVFVILTMVGYNIFRHLPGIPLEYPCFLLGVIIFGIVLKIQISQKNRLKQPEGALP
jgi:TRAP transporter 4TM/12TM fusion protein